MSTLFRILIGFTIASILFSCSVARRALPPPADYSRAATAPLPMSLGVPVDSMVPSKRPSKRLSKTTEGDERKTALSTPKRGFLGIIGRKKTKGVVQNSPYLPSKKCKGCVFNLGSGNLSVAGKKAQAATGTGAALTVAGKKGQAAKADSGGFVGQATAKQQAAAGKGVTLDPVAHRTLLQHLLPGGGWTGAGLLFGILGGGALVYWLVAGGGIMWLLALLKRKKSNDPTA